MSSELKSKSHQGLKTAGVEITGNVSKKYAEILTPEAVNFVAGLARNFEKIRQGLLSLRQIRQNKIKDGEMFSFLVETKNIRESNWQVASIPNDLRERKVEITGPVDRKMIINALNSGANVFMADFEDSNSPTWDNNIQGQINLKDAVNGTITYTSLEGKVYKLNNKIATLVVRPRGWHLDEKHLLVDGEKISASLFDFGLYFFHNVKSLIKKGIGPYFYLPKLESHLEARLWNDVFNFSQRKLGIPLGTIKATVLIETIPAAFEMDEILYELRDHSSGLNCGRWDYIFSFIKKFRNNPKFVFPDRAQVTMDKHFLDSYVKLLIKTCHKRGIHAMGGMAAQIPIKNDPALNEKALEKVKLDKEREAKAGHDGTWVAHPGLVHVAMDIFNKYVKGPNQIQIKREDVEITKSDLVLIPEGSITEVGLRTNIDVGIQYLESWLKGQGCVPLYNLMEDAATAEISRTQVWQWVKHKAKLNSGEIVSSDLVKKLIREELEKIKKTLGDENFNSGKYILAARIYEDITTTDNFPEFLTQIAYQYID